MKSADFIRHLFACATLEDAVALLTADRAFMLAVHDAAPALAREFEPGARCSRRAMAKLVKYGIRAATRCTPYGLFASVGAIDRDRGGGDTLTLSATRFAHARRPRPQIEPQLDTVCANNVLRTIDDRVITYHLSDTVRSAGRAPHASLRAIPLLTAALERAARPVTFAELQAGLCASFGHPAEVVTGFLLHLVESGVLVRASRHDSLLIDERAYEGSRNVDDIAPGDLAATFANTTHAYAGALPASLTAQAYQAARILRSIQPAMSL